MGEPGQVPSIPSHTELRRSRGIEGTGHLLERSLDRARTRGAVHIAHAQRRLGDATFMGFAFSLVNASSSSASWRASRAVGFCVFAVALILILPLLLIALHDRATAPPVCLAIHSDPHRNWENTPSDAASPPECRGPRRLRSPPD